MCCDMQFQKVTHIAADECVAEGAEESGVGEPPGEEDVLPEGVDV